MRRYVSFDMISENNGSLEADNNAGVSFEGVHLNVSFKSIENITGSKQLKNAFSSSVENTTDEDTYKTPESSNLGHQSKLLNI